VKEHIDRDDAVDRLLRASLTDGAGRSSPSDGQCLDAETVAAWVEGHLPASLASAAEAHAADCARCQALLAAFARTAPPAPAQKPLFERWHLRWLVPVTAAAAALVIYVVVPRQSAVEEAEQMARQQYSAPAPSAASTPPAAAEPRAESFRDSLAKRDEALRPNEAVKPVDRFEQNAAAGRRDAEEQERREAQAPSQKRLDPSAQTSTLSADAVRERSAALRDAPGVPSAPAGASAAGASAPTASADARLKQEPAAPAPVEARGIAAARETAVVGRVAGTMVPVSEIVSPDPSRRWRIGQPGMVQRSMDGGTSWETLATGVSAPLRAGSAPSPTVVWLVGGAGTVLLSTDGRQFRQVQSPARVDLVAIQATDARTATVTAADGRVFRTTDGGQTWR
jgi:hypothetical protein